MVQGLRKEERRVRVSLEIMEMKAEAMKVWECGRWDNESLRS